MARFARPGSPLTRHPLGRRNARPCVTAFVIGALLAATAIASDQQSCPFPDCDFPETNGAVVFAVGAPSLLARDLTFAVQVADGEGECQEVQGLLIKSLSKAFPTWRYVPTGPSDIQIIYQSSFSLCVDECEDRPLPQAAQAQLVLGRGEVQAHWSDESHWRARGRLVTLFTTALHKAVHGRPA